MRRLLTLIACSALVLGALAVPATADEDGPEHESDRPGPDHGPRNESRYDHPEPRNGTPADDHRPERNESRAEDAARCRAEYNETGVVPEDCKGPKDFQDGAHKARREAHAILGALSAIEKRITKLELKEMRISSALEFGNLTVNQTADYEAKLKRIQDAQDHMLEKYQDLQEKLDGLKDRWLLVQEHVDERREHRGEDAGRPDHAERPDHPEDLEDEVDDDEPEEGS